MADASGRGTAQWREATQDFSESPLAALENRAPVSVRKGFCPPAKDLAVRRGTDERPRSDGRSEASRRSRSSGKGNRRERSDRQSGAAERGKSVLRFQIEMITRSRGRGDETVRTSTAQWPQRSITAKRVVREGKPSRAPHVQGAQGARKRDSACSTASFRSDRRHSRWGAQQVSRRWRTFGSKPAPAVWMKFRAGR